MTNPWLDIPLGDYEGHMGLPHVAQTALLAELFGRALRRFQPASVALLGCAGGNGLERVDPTITTRVVAVDLNPDYVACARQRYGDRLRGLKTYAGDIQTEAVTFAPVELAFAGLLLEYVDVGVTLRRIRELLVDTAVLVTVVQLPSAKIAEITPSSFASLEALAAVMRLVSPEELSAHALATGLCEVERDVVRSAGGKEFCAQVFRPT